MIVRAELHGIVVTRRLRRATLLCVLLLLAAPVFAQTQPANETFDQVLAKYNLQKTRSCRKHATWRGIIG